MTFAEITLLLFFASVLATELAFLCLISVGEREGGRENINHIKFPSQHFDNKMAFRKNSGHTISVCLSLKEPLSKQFY